MTCKNNLQIYLTNFLPQLQKSKKQLHKHLNKSSNNIKKMNKNNIWKG